LAVWDADPAEALAVDQALIKLEAVAPRQAEIVKLRYFAALTVDETAEALEVWRRTVDAEWRLAQAWLYRELGGEP
jgi:DNA-directed RNA polymerase specialized sigma24 family protein